MLCETVIWIVIIFDVVHVGGDRWSAVSASRGSQKSNPLLNQPWYWHTGKIISRLCSLMYWCLNRIRTNHTEQSEDQEGVSAVGLNYGAGGVKKVEITLLEILWKIWEGKKDFVAIILYAVFYYFKIIISISFFFQE